ncbi:MAG: methionine aminotransferase [Calditrichae bacterium]|nr:methionine aminotransferase [Calditrichota bacterium]MCB9059437.1 methionine aminotransferase [Calditrichia bacterium]
MQINEQIKLTSKQPDLKTSIFSIMSALAAKEKAINLSQGFPDFPCHPKLIELMHRHMLKGNNQYAPMPGVACLRENLVQKTENLYGAKYDPESEITITSGATEALYAAITAVVQPGDEVIIFEPWYDAYIPMIEYSGGKPVTIPLVLPDFRIDWQQVKHKINTKTRAIIINSPHNPTGAVLSEKDIQNLIQIVKTTDIILISDEVYEHIIFDGFYHQSLARFPELTERSFVISSLGKTFHATGWKVGYCMAPFELMKEFRKIHQFITFSINTPAQYAYADFLKEPEHYLELPGFYQQKRDLFLNLTKESAFLPIENHGTYFQLMTYSAISDENDIEFVRRLAIEHKIAAIPTSVFYRNGQDNKIIRFCFAKKNETLEQAAEILCRI